MKRLFLYFICVALVSFTACKPKAKDITPLQRKQAASLVSEAQFAMQMKDLPRAEGLYAQAAELCPDSGDYWVSLGAARRRLDNRPGAKKAYEAALGSFIDAYKADPKNPEPLMRRIYVLALLGRVDDARAVLDRARKEHGTHPRVRTFTDRSFEDMLTDVNFKALAL